MFSIKYLYCNREFELTNHLGNVQVTISDKRIRIPNPNNNQQTAYYLPVVLTTTDYYPFGMQMPSRTFSATAGVTYKFGFNGQLEDNEITGVDGSHTTAMFWEYDSRIGRRWNIDPEYQKVPWISTYACFNDNPILNVDPNGRFSPRIHEILIANSGIKYKLTDSDIYWLSKGVKDADYFGALSDFHFDNLNNYQEISLQWNRLNDRLNNDMGKYGDSWSLGRDIHNAQDFYAHSNYVELYVQYYQSQGGDMSKFDPNMIPTWDEKDESFTKYIQENGLRTGEFDIMNNEKMPWTDKDKLSKNSHYKMNKDDNTTSLKGKEKVKGTKWTYHNIASNVAQRHTNNIIKKFKAKKNE